MRPDDLHQLPSPRPLVKVIGARGRCIGERNSSTRSGVAPDSRTHQLKEEDVPYDPRTNKTDRRILRAKVEDHYDMLLREARSGDREGSGSSGGSGSRGGRCLPTVMMMAASLAVVLKLALSVFRKRSS
jgi:hypothetical protein